MSKDNILFSIIGLLLGFIVGFMFANYFNYRGVGPRASVAQQGSGLPPDHPPLSSNAVAEQGSGGMPPEVQAAIARAKNEPNNFEAQMKAAELYYRIKRYETALEYLTRANQLRPDSLEAMVALGNVNFDAERYEVAEKWYTAALARKPDDVNVRTDLGLTFFFRQPPDLDRAIAEFRRSLEYNPAHEQTLRNLAVALKRKGDIKGAQEALSRLEAVNPNNEAIPGLRAELGTQ
jgi:tetratricopeptide (TPR) repeat protein